MAPLTLLAQAPPEIDAGSTAWMLTSSALVLLMIPGLALFYGGLVRQKNVLTTMMHSFVAMAVIGVQWIVIGYALAFGDSWQGLVGWDTGLICLNGMEHTAMLGDKAIPAMVFVMFQGKFAIITPALISGAIAERVKFSGYVLFILLWATLVYDPLAHWVWNENGWLFQRGVLDFAGGTVVHISAGVSGLVLAMVIGRRRDYPEGVISPNSMVLTLLGAGLLWFGWFGFNAGSAVAVESPVAGSIAGLAFTTTQTSAAAAALVWILIEWIVQGKPTALGMASGIVAGLVAITPAAGHVTPAWALVIGAVASIVCYAAVSFKNKLGYDDSLDAFGVHGVGGFWGAIATGLFVSVGGVGLVYGEVNQVWQQFVGAFAAIVYCVVMTLIIAYVVKATVGLRCSDADERDGLDLAVHGERGYHL